MRFAKLSMSPDGWGVGVLSPRSCSNAANSASHAPASTFKRTQSGKVLTSISADSACPGRAVNGPGAIANPRPKGKADSSGSTTAGWGGATTRHQWSGAAGSGAKTLSATEAVSASPFAVRRR